MPIPVIAKALKLHKKEVLRIVKRFEETGCIEDCRRSERPQTTKIPALKHMFKKKIDGNPQRSVGKLSKEHNVDCESMHRLVKKDLKLIPYKRAKDHHLSDKMKRSRVENCKKMKSLCRGDAPNQILFTDEKVFVV